MESGVGGGMVRREGAFTLSQAQFNRLVSDHAPALYRLAYRLVGDAHEAEDVVQDAFRSAWKGRARFDATRGGRAWLVAILRRRVADHWRRRPPPRSLDDDAELEIGVPATDPLFDQYTDEMQQALDRLPAALRETLLLVVVGELTHQEAAEVLDVPLGTVLSRVSRARERLREYWLAEQKRH
jgi:RNA polymerase sigma-70 factor, ECF subfamily